MECGDKKKPLRIMQKSLQDTRINKGIKQCECDIYQKNFFLSSIFAH